MAPIKMHFVPLFVVVALAAANFAIGAETIDERAQVKVPVGKFRPTGRLLYRCNVFTCSKWALWTPCSVTCGKGHRTRTRKCTLSSRWHGIGYPKCPTSEIQKCYGPKWRCPTAPTRPTPTRPGPAPVDCTKCPNTVNYIGYMPDPKDCRKYYVCVFNSVSPNSTFRVVSKSCSRGLMWNEEILTCVRPAAASKRCGGKGTPCASGKKYYADLKNCAAYYQCVPGSATRMCCPAGTRWLQLKSRCGYGKTVCRDKCVKDVTKPGRCPPVRKDRAGLCWERCRTDSGCPGSQKCCSNGCGHTCMNPIRTPSTTETTPSGARTTPASTGTTPAGGCSYDQVFYLPCSDTGSPFPKDHSCQKAYVTNVGKVSKYRYGKFGATCRFNRRSNLEIPFFNNWFYGVRNFSAVFWFKPYRASRSVRMQYLIHNGDCKDKPSIAIYLYRPTYRSKWILRARINGVKVGDVQVKTYQWVYAALVYNGNGALLSTWSKNVKQNKVNSSIRGPITNTHCPMTIGKKVSKNTFYGLVDEVRMFKRTLTSTQVTNLRTKNRVQ